MTSAKARVISILVVFATLAAGWRHLAAGVCINVAAHYLAHALVAPQPMPAHLAQSQTWAARALRIRPSSSAARRLTYRALLATDQPPEGNLGDDPRAFEDSLTRFYAGQLLWLAGDAAQAVRIWQMVKNVHLYFMHAGDQALASGDAQAASRYYRISLAIDDGFDARRLQMYTNLCERPTLLGEAADALGYCAAAVQAQRSVWTLVRLGRALTDSGDHQAALTVLQEAQALNPRVGSVFYVRGLAYQRLGQRDLAVQAYEQALALEPRQQYFNMTAAQLYEQLGESAKAYCCYWRVLRYGSSEDLKQRAHEAMQRMEALGNPPVCEET